MKVQDVMQSSAPFVEESLPVKNLARLIFTTNIPGFPVVKGKKLVGFITEEDVFFRIYKTGAKTEKKESPEKVLEMQVKDLMVKNAISVSPNTDLIETQLIMYKNNFTRLPVVDSKGNLMGAVTRADIYKHILEEEIPKLEEGQYANFVLENYDKMVDWDKRFDFEFPTLLRVFSRNNIKKVLELGIWTGEYTLGLAKEGVLEKIVGVDSNASMIRFANAKKAKLPEAVKNKVSFVKTNYTDLDKLFKPGSFDGMICIGGVLPYIPEDLESLFTQVHKLVKKDGVIVLQLLNLERVVNQRRRFLYFKITDALSPANKENMYVEFFDKKNESTLIHNVINFTSDGKSWVYQGLNSINVKYIKNNQIEPLLKKAGFKDIVITGNKGEYKGAYGQMSLVKPFDPESSEWMTIIARV